MNNPVAMVDARPGMYIGRFVLRELSLLRDLCNEAVMSFRATV